MNFKNKGIVKGCCLLLATGFILLSCQKASEAVAGNYSGNVTINGSSAGTGTAAVTVVSDNKVDILFTHTGDTTLNFVNVGVAGVEPPYNLVLSATNANLYGNASGNGINFTIYDTSGTQTGF